jgi:methionyl-tRNA synthetase
MKKLLVTAGLPYSNGRLHVGHIAGAYLPADIYVRYQKLTGRDVRYVCGSDDHGVAIMLSAQKEDKTPAAVAQHYNKLQQRDFESIGIDFDVYGSTSQTEFHAKCSQDFFLKLYERGDFEKQSSVQFYDEEREMFLPDRFVKGTCGYCNTEDQNGDQCENCGKVLDAETLKDARSVFSGQPATTRETVHWYLDLSRFEKEVTDWIESAHLREHTKSFVKGLLKTGLVKRSMTRDIDWGIPLPIDDEDAQGKVLYVWFDAPIGYISNTMALCKERDGDPEAYAEWWKSEDTEILHFVGEDNTIFHCVIWIAMLASEGSFQLPEGVIVNQFLNIQFPGKDQEKISKSRGTAIWIGDFIENGGNVDTLRYYLTAIAPEKARTVFKPEDLIQRNNSDLANTLGNFVNRIVSFTHKYCGPVIPDFDEGALQEVDTAFLASIGETHQLVSSALDEFGFKKALEHIMEFARGCNKYVDDKAPWVSRKTDMEATQLTLNCALQAIHYLGLVLKPFLPESAKKLASITVPGGDERGWGDSGVRLDSGAPLGESAILFQKLEEDIYGNPSA